MKYQNYILKMLKRLRKDESGNISMMFGAVFIVLIACIGTGYDMNQLVGTKQKASSIADTAALTAAVYYSEHKESPQSLEDGLMHEHEYDASDLGYAFNGLSSKMARNVTIKVSYDPVNEQAVARVYGHTESAFMQVFGHNTMKFEASATAKFNQPQLRNPASVILVLDNSGSMWFDDLPNDPFTGENPSEGQRRIDALKIGVNGLMNKLRALNLDNKPRGERVLRTGMINYSSSILSGPGGTSVPMKWGTITPAQVASMVPGGGTNSDPPMAQAKLEMDREPAIHRAETGEANPLKFLIFMTDGQNNNTSRNWESLDGTEYWRKLVKPAHYQRYCRWYRRNRCRSYGYRYVPDEYDYQSNETEPSGGDWDEGMMSGNLDTLTRATCDALRADNVQVYSIGFALEAGSFETNEWADTPGGYTPMPVSSDVKRNAIFMMQECSGRQNPDRFSVAGNAESLKKAFDVIGTKIARDVIRLSM